MAKFRINKTKNFTVMSNRHFKEKEMSLKAKGLLSLMFSLPDDWDYSIRGLVSICKENESALKSALNELKQFGYLKVTKEMPNLNNGGRINYIYDIYEEPIQERQKQGVENLCVENLCVENCGQLNTDNKINNNKLCKEEKHIYGEFKNVFLTDEEYNKIQEKGLTYLIEELSGYIESKGKKYKSHYATILNWSRRQKKTKEAQKKASFDVDKYNDYVDNLDLKYERKE